MKKALLLITVSLFAAGAFLAGCKAKVDGAAPGADSSKAKTEMTPAERGKYIVNAIAGCNDCHTPWKMGPMGPEPDMSKMLSGSPEGMEMKPVKVDMPWAAAINITFTAFQSPMGIAYSKNLTPDSTGLGTWDETTFMLALRNGKHMGNGRPLLPPMPWMVFKNMTDDDLKAIYAYLKTIPPVKNHVPEAVLFPPPPGMGGPPPAAKK
jgi:hypothetical protein